MEKIQEGKEKFSRHRERIRADQKGSKGVGAIAVGGVAESYNEEVRTTRSQAINDGRRENEEDNEDQAVQEVVTDRNVERNIREEYHPEDIDDDGGGGVLNHGLVVADAVVVPPEPKNYAVGVPVDSDGGKEVREARQQVTELQDELLNMKQMLRRTAILLLVISVLVVSTVLPVVYTDDRDEDDGLDETAAQTASAVSPTMPPTAPITMPLISPADAVVVTSSPADVKQFCGGTLAENTAYILLENITCASGPALQSSTYLDCQGHSIASLGGTDTVGVYIPPSATNAVVHNCNIQGFHFGAVIEGSDSLVSNIAIDDAEEGIQNSGRNTQVDCSIIERNWYGVYSREASIGITSSLVENNGKEGILVLGGNATVSCSEVRSNADEAIDACGGVDSIRIENTIVTDSGGDNIWTDADEATFINVVSCNSRVWDFYLDFFRSIAHQNLTCDSHKVHQPLSCATPCPSDLSSLALPDACPVCQNGVGPYPV